MFSLNELFVSGFGDKALDIDVDVAKEELQLPENSRLAGMDVTLQSHQVSIVLKIPAMRPTKDTSAVSDGSARTSRRP